jgi:fatty acid desaturase
LNPRKAFVLDHHQSARRDPDGAQPDPRYRELRRRAQEAGLFGPARGAYIARIALFSTVCLGAWLELLRAPSIGVRIACWAAIGFVMVQAAFVSHEAMHGSISRSARVSQAIGHFLNTFLIGFSFSYFCRSHALHHAHCNEGESDPDTMSQLFSVFPASVNEKRGIGRWMTRFQVVLLPVFFPTWALIMKWDALTYIVRRPRKMRTDLIVLGAHLLFWFGATIPVLGFTTALNNYLGWSAFAGIYLAAVIPIGHVARREIRAGERVTFLEQQIGATRNLGSSRLLDFLFMGVNSHVEHHLFPTVPSTRLHRGRAVLRDFCAAERLPYQEVRFDAAFAEVMRHFAQVGALCPIRDKRKLDDEVEEAAGAN